jgi:hypothetical protein
MRRITIKAVHTDGEPRRWTLSERIVADNLASNHYAAQPIERLRSATAEAEALERQPTPDTDLSAAQRSTPHRRGERGRAHRVRERPETEQILHRAQDRIPVVPGPDSCARLRR